MSHTVAFKQSGYFSHLTSLVRSLIPIGLLHFYLPYAFTIMHKSGRLEWKVKTGEAWETL